MNNALGQLRALLAAADTDPALVLLRGWQHAGRLWQGGMGAVALVERDGQRAALKFVLPEYSDDTFARSLFDREVANMMALEHPHIVQVFGAGVYLQMPFFLMEYCDGGSVWDVGASQPLEFDRAVSITLAVLDALDYAHHATIPNVKTARGGLKPGHTVVHRDMKPQNILLKGAPAGEVAKVADFGLAKARSLAGATGMSRLGDVGGTPPFMCRQQLDNYLYAGPEVDVWATAASLYWMLTRHFPRNFGGNDPYDTVKNTNPVPIRQRGVSLRDRVADLLDAALDDSAPLRYQDAKTFRNALHEATS